MIKEIKMLSYQELKNQNMNAMRNKDKKLQSVQFRWIFLLIYLNICRTIITD